eukprot:g6773.t1
MPNTYMSLAIDLGDKTSPYGSVHSRHKLELGTRLGNQALSAIYGIKIENGKRPVLAYVERQDNTTLTSSFFLTFSNAKGVQVRNATVGWEICDDDGIKCASGTVTSVNRTTVLLKSNSAAPTSSKATLIRYLWSSYACEYLGCSLYGLGSASDALPVGPFKISVKHTSRNTRIRI